MSSLLDSKLINKNINKNEYNKNEYNKNEYNKNLNNTIDKNLIDKNIKNTNIKNTNINTNIKNTNINTNYNKVCNIFESDFYNDFNKNIQSAQFDYNKFYNLDNNHIFCNVVLQKLYDTLYSTEVSMMKNTTEIFYVLHPLILDVINNIIAYDELRQYNIFTPIVEHIEYDKKYFKNMDLDESMCFAMWMNVYH